MGAESRRGRRLLGVAVAIVAFGCGAPAPAPAPTPCRLPSDFGELPAGAAQIARAGCGCFNPCMGPPQQEGPTYTSHFHVKSAPERVVSECTARVVHQADDWAKRHGLAFESGRGTPRRFERYVIVKDHWFISIFYSAPGDTAELFVGIVTVPNSEPDLAAIERSYGTPVQIADELERAARAACSD